MHSAPAAPCNVPAVLQQLNGQAAQQPPALPLPARRLPVQQGHTVNAKELPVRLRVQLAVPVPIAEAAAEAADIQAVVAEAADIQAAVAEAADIQAAVAEAAVTAVAAEAVQALIAAVVAAVEADSPVAEAAEVAAEAVQAEALADNQQNKETHTGLLIIYTCAHTRLVSR